MSPGFWLKTALANFTLAALLGLLLRFAFVQEISWLKYSHFLHAHSHVAMLGWVFLALFALLIAAFLSPEKQKRKAYFWIFILSQLSVVGMLLTFPWLGYAPLSIAFSTLHVLLTYAFAWFLWRDLPANQGQPMPLSGLLVRASLVFLVLSSLGLWAMAPIIILELKRSIWYYLAVQFYLHFQFNGWFLFACLGLLVKEWENKRWQPPARMLTWFFPILIAATILTFALAVAWSNPHPLVFAVNSTGVSLQLAAVALLFGMSWKWGKNWLHALPRWVKLLLGIAIMGFALKILIQTLVVLPFIATVAYTIRNFVIGFIHLLLLGTITPFLLGFSAQLGLFNTEKRLFRLGISFFLAGLVLSELILFVQGVMFWGAWGFLPHYYEYLFGVSCLLPLGILGIWISTWKGGIAFRLE